MTEKRRDKNGRILRKGELRRNGERQVEYSWRLVEPHHIRNSL